MKYFERVLQAHNGNLIAHELKKYVPDIHKCSAENYRKTKLKKLDLKDLSGAFLILFLGLVLSTIVFFLENIFGRFAKKENRNQIINIEGNRLSNIK